mmetsp:Transcript_28673/g.48815  ORF Transcript_28673/g.48815 Transcript_28673/m.48815 type:complete len:85 (-) Transcript_28673:974-1228(-)
MRFTTVTTWLLHINTIIPYMQTQLVGLPVENLNPTNQFQRSGPSAEELSSMDASSGEAETTAPFASFSAFCYKCEQLFQAMYKM